MNNKIVTPFKGFELVYHFVYLINTQQSVAMGSIAEIMHGVLVVDLFQLGEPDVVAYMESEIESSEMFTIMDNKMEAL